MEKNKEKNLDTYIGVKVNKILEVCLKDVDIDTFYISNISEGVKVFYQEKERSDQVRILLSGITTNVSMLLMELKAAKDKESVDSAINNFYQLQKVDYQYFAEKIFHCCNIKIENDTKLNNEISEIISVKELLVRVREIAIGITRGKNESTKDDKELETPDIVEYIKKNISNYIEYARINYGAGSKEHKNAWKIWSQLRFGNSLEAFIEQYPELLTGFQDLEEHRKGRK